MPKTQGVTVSVDPMSPVSVRVLYFIKNTTVDNIDIYFKWKVLILEQNCMKSCILSVNVVRGRDHGVNYAMKKKLAKVREHTT